MNRMNDTFTYEKEDFALVHAHTMGNLSNRLRVGYCAVSGIPQRRRDQGLRLKVHAFDKLQTSYVVDVKSGRGKHNNLLIGYIV